MGSIALLSAAHRGLFVPNRLLCFGSMFSTMATSRPTVLLIEDSTDHAVLISRALEDQGADVCVTHVSDGESALALLLGEREALDLGNLRVILLDLRLPRVDGFSVLERIKQAPHLRRIPVVILTTSAADGDVNRAYDLHANSYLVKPTDFRRFSELLGTLRGYWMESNVSPGGLA